MKIYKVIFLSLLFLFFVGCSTRNSREEEEFTEMASTEEVAKINEMDERLTLEYLCANSDLEESDLEDVEFDAFVDYWGLTKSNLKKQTSVKYLLNAYKELKYKIKIPYYSEYESTTDIFLAEYKDKIDTIVIDNYKASGSAGKYEVVVIDFGLGYVFKSNTIKTITENDVVKETDDELKDSIISSLDKFDIYNWKQQDKEHIYDGFENSDDGGYSFCYLKIKLNDGTIYGTSYVKTGEDFESIDQFYGFVDEVSQLAGAK